MMRHSPPVRGFCQKLKGPPSHCRPTFAPFCPHGSRGLPAGVSPYVFNRSWNGAVQSDRVVPPHSQDRHGQDYAASRGVQRLTGVSQRCRCGIVDALARGCATSPTGNWIRSNFCLGTSPSRPLSATSGASRSSAIRSMTVWASSPKRTDRRTAGRPDCPPLATDRESSPQTVNGRPCDVAGDF